jgi:asparagine synthase (glutamine-hydrolysing)
MGTFTFVVYDVPNPPLDISFMNSFIKMGECGNNTMFTNMVTSSTATIGAHNISQAALQLSKRQLAEYRPLTCFYGSHRLPINDDSLDAVQPFEDPILHQVRKYADLAKRPQRKLLGIGEIYNYNELKSTNSFTEKDLQSQSDIEIILPMYIKHGIKETLQQLDGDFAFAITEGVQSNNINLDSVNAYVARDAFGTRPLYVARYKKGFMYIFVSELKGLPAQILGNPDFDIFEFPPGCYWSLQAARGRTLEKEFVEYHDLAKYESLDSCTINSADPETLYNIYSEIRNSLVQSIEARSWSNQPHPIGVLLSGGFDSGIMLMLLAKVLKEKGHDFANVPLHAFTLDLGAEASSLEIACAQQCVKHVEDVFGIDVIHHVVSIRDLSLVLKDKEFMKNIIYRLETDNPSMIRNGLTVSNLMNYISTHTDVKIIFSGDGLDELCGDDDIDDCSFQLNSMRSFKDMCNRDIVRNVKLASAYNLELRFPYLDKSFVELVMSIHPKMRKRHVYDVSKAPIEKYIIRKAFDDNNNEFKYLPDDILWRTRDSSLVPNGLVDILTNWFEDAYSNEQVFLYTEQQGVRGAPFQSKEQFHYTCVFSKMFSGRI